MSTLTTRPHAAWLRELTMLAQHLTLSDNSTDRQLGACVLAIIRAERDGRLAALHARLTTDLPPPTTPPAIDNR